MKERTKEMLQMRLDGKSCAEIGKHFNVSQQRVVELLRDFKLSKRYILEGSEGATEKTYKAVLEKLGITPRN